MRPHVGHEPLRFLWGSMLSSWHHSRGNVRRYGRCMICFAVRGTSIKHPMTIHACIAPYIMYGYRAWTWHGWGQWCGPTQLRRLQARCYHNRLGRMLDSLWICASTVSLVQLSQDRSFCVFAMPCDACNDMESSSQLLWWSRACAEPGTINDSRRDSTLVSSLFERVRSTYLNLTARNLKDDCTFENHKVNILIWVVTVHPVLIVATIGPWSITFVNTNHDGQVIRPYKTITCFACGHHAMSYSQWLRAGRQS